MLLPLLPLTETQEGQWECRNRRRLELLDKQFSNTLTETERQELAELRTSMSTELNVVMPLPFDHLNELERYLNSRR